jgi:hypothetical protein
MSLKRGTVLTLLLILLLLTAGVVSWYLPLYVEHRFLPQILQQAGVRQYTLSVRRLGFSGLDLGQVTLGDAEQPWLSVGSIQVDYSLSGIVAREINAIVVNGLQLQAAVQDGGIILPGLESDGHSDSSLPVDQSLELPVKIGRMDVRNAYLTITYEGKRLSVPFALRILRKKAGGYDCLLQLRPRGQEIQVAAETELTDNHVHVRLAADSLHLGVFSDLIETVVPLSIKGTAVIQGTAAAQLLPLQLISVDADCKLYGGRVNAGSIRSRNGTGDDQQEIPLRLRISGDQTKMRTVLTGLEVEAPFPVRIPAVEGTISYSAAGVDLQGNVQLELANEGLTPELTQKTRSPVRVTADYSGHYTPATHDWRLTVPITENRPPPSAPPFGLRLGSLAVSYDQTRFSLAAEGTGARGRLDYKFGLTGMSLSSGTATVKAPTVSLTGHTILGQDSGTESHLAGDFPGLHMAAGPADLQGDVAVAAVFASSGPRAAAADGLSLQGSIKLRNGIARDKDLDIEADAVRGEIPFRLPAPPAGDRGEVIIPAIRWQQKDLGSLTVAIRQQGTGLVLDGEHKDRLIKGFALHLAGQVDYAAPEAFAASWAFNTVSASDPVEADLGMLSPALQGFSLRGRLGLEGAGGVERGIVRTRLKSSLQDTSLQATDKKLRIEGINATLAFADLPDIRSNPQQNLRFSRATFGDFVVEDGDIDFQLESDASLLIEKSACRWAGGSVYTQALRIHPGVDNYDLTLFCDRLKLASLLEQFGAADAEGDGTVSGRLPLIYENGKVFVGDGFLYSSPGEGGTIRITGADALAAGIPKNTPQFAQIDFAMAALKNFSYKWVKLNTRTEDENLVLTMQLDGMPDRTLPFRYDSKLGQFSRIDLRTEKGILQPIRLDVNFRLPLNSLLDYSKGIGKLIDRMK